MKTHSHVVVLTGGTGGSKFVWGVQQVLGADALTAIVNTGDDLTWHGLHVSPDIDSLVYALSGLLSRERGWGVEGDTFHCLEQLRRLGSEEWFQIGDRDLALHIARTRLLAHGCTLSEATDVIADRLHVSARVLPMSNDRVQTRLATSIGELAFQEYFVRERWKPEVREVRFEGSAQAKPAPGVLEAILAAKAVVIAPSNPVTSIGPILAVPGIREALCKTTAAVAAISPIVDGAAVSGPAGHLMKSRGLPVSVVGVAQAYAGFLRFLIADEQDRGVSGDFAGAKLCFTDTIMKTDDDKIRLAKAVLDVLGLETSFRNAVSESR